MENLFLFSERVKTLRESKKLSQGDLAQMVGLKRQSINDIEHGRAGTNIEKIIAFADALNVSTDYLLGKSDDPTPSDKKFTLEEIELLNLINEVLDEMPELRDDDVFIKKLKIGIETDAETYRKLARQALKKT